MARSAYDVKQAPREMLEEDMAIIREQVSSCSERSSTACMLFPSSDP